MVKGKVLGLRGKGKGNFNNNMRTGLPFLLTYSRHSVGLSDVLIPGRLRLF